MNQAATNSPTVAERARAALDGLSLVAGEPFYAAADGVVVTGAPLPADEAAASGADHEVTISTGFPPDPGTAGITVWVQRRGPTGGQLERVGETDRFGTVLFRAGEAGTEYRLTASRGSGVRPLPAEAAAILPFPPGAKPACPVCSGPAIGWVAKVAVLRAGLAAGHPVCRGHLTGPDSVILAAAHDGWQRNAPEVFAASTELLGDLLDANSPAHRGFLALFPAEEQALAFNEVAGVLSTVIAVGYILARRPGRAAAAGHAAAVHLQSVVRAGWTAARPAHARDAGSPQPVESLLSRLATRLRRGWADGFLEFRRLCAAITRDDSVRPESV
jgi:hypothetical protein